MMIGSHAATRTMSAPNSDWHVQPPALLSVRADEDEDIERAWTHFVDGRSVVTGYRIVNHLQLPDAFKRRFHE
jgi:hypothetical protein